MAVLDNGKGQVDEQSELR